VGFGPYKDPNHSLDTRIGCPHPAFPYLPPFLGPLKDGVFKSLLVRFAAARPAGHAYFSPAAGLFVAPSVDSRQ
jgi:hypothetical protein